MCVSLPEIEVENVMAEKKQPSVLIMMATYNGEKYIREQIDSIINQQYENWTLIIQDDHSRDQTMEILDSYAKEYCNINIKVSEEPGGANKNFHSLINWCKANTDYDYYMFADQDDVWYPNKLSCMVKFLEENISSQIPTLVYADMALVDGSGEYLGGTILSKTGNCFVNMTSYFFSHSVYGCNLMMNRKLFVLPPNVDIKNKEELIISHDSYYAKSAALTGKIYYLDAVLMNYRRHGGNVTAAFTYDFGIQKILSRVKNIEKLAQDHAYTYSQTLLVLQKYHSLGVSKEQEVFMKKIERTIRNGGIRAACYLVKEHVSWGHRVRTISHFSIMVMGIYKPYLLT